MVRNQQKTLRMNDLCRKKQELEEVRRILNAGLDVSGFDYQELLAVSRRMDKFIVEYMKLENNDQDNLCRCDKH